MSGSQRVSTARRGPLPVAGSSHMHRRTRGRIHRVLQSFFQNIALRPGPLRRRIRRSPSFLRGHRGFSPPVAKLHHLAIAMVRKVPLMASSPPVARNSPGPAAGACTPSFSSGPAGLICRSDSRSDAPRCRKQLPAMRDVQAHREALATRPVAASEMWPALPRQPARVVQQAFDILRAHDLQKAFEFDDGRSEIAARPTKRRLHPVGASGEEAGRPRVMPNHVA